MIPSSILYVAILVGYTATVFAQTQQLNQQQQTYDPNNPQYQPYGPVNIGRQQFGQNRAQQLYDPITGRQQQQQQQPYGDVMPSQNPDQTNYNDRNYNAFNNPLYGGNSIEGVDENSYCPEFWIAFRKVCYRFIKSPKRNWYDAKKICKAYNAELLNVDSLEKHAFIMKQLIVQNHRQNRYFISARQTSPNTWTNDDNTPLVHIDDSFVYEDKPFDPDLLQDNLQNSQYFNRFDTSRSFNPLLQYDKTRLVYGYSPAKDKWVFIPTYEFETHLFICQSSQLYNPNNINLLQDDKRPFDYGLEITDKRFTPRGPYFIKQPQDTTFDTAKRTIRNDVTMSCLSGGYPTPTYQWYKEEYTNDNLTYYRIDPLTNSRYTISGGNLIIYDPNQQRDQGTYHCVAENRFGKIRSESIKLNFGYIMEFNLKRSGESGDSNWGKSLFCDPPQHYPSVKYYWSRNSFPNFVDEDQRVFVSDDGALYFSALETVDRANYSCTVQSTVGSAGRNGPFFPLRIKSHPNYQALLFANTFPKIFPEAPIVGESIRLECFAFGYPVPSYNWTRKDFGLPRQAYQINYQRVLIIPNATLNDNGEYICTTKNDRKSMQKSIHLNIQMKPNFTIPLRDKVKDTNSDVSFICEANAIPDVNYTWYKNAELMDIEKLNRDKYTIQDNVLTIKRLNEDEDNGMYQCRAENQLKAVYSSAQLRVLSMKPSFLKYPLESEIYAIYNGNTSIVCDPEAAPRPKIQWKKDGNIIGAGGHRKILPTGTLIISPTSRDDEGVYTCVATNTYGTDESKARVIVLRKLEANRMLLKVKLNLIDFCLFAEELRFTQALEPHIYLQVYDLLFLHCDVSFDEVLDVAFVWKHNGQTIKDKKDDRIVSK